MLDADRLAGPSFEPRRDVLLDDLRGHAGVERHDLHGWGLEDRQQVRGQAGQGGDTQDDQAEGGDDDQVGVAEGGGDEVHARGLSADAGCGSRARSTA